MLLAEVEQITSKCFSDTVELHIHINSRYPALIQDPPALLFRVFLVTIVLVSRPRMVVPESTLAFPVDSLTSRKALIIGLGIYSPSPEFRNQQLGDLLEGSWRCDVADVEPVYICFADPLKHLELANHRRE